MMTTTEVPTFFGPSDSPLFGAVHLPVDNEIRGGVLICGSLGKEAMDSARLHRALAEGLADHGFAVLRFDYLGTGDSALGQVRDDAVVNWIASVGHALDYLRLIDAESTTAIGIRAGCLILQEYLAQYGQTRKVERVVYLDPAGTGRRYLREHTALFGVAVGEDADTPGEVSVIGGRFSRCAAMEFAALRMAADPVSAHGVDDVLLVGRPEETDQHLAALAAAPGVDSIVAAGLPECARPWENLLPIPTAAVDSVVEWVAAKCPTRTHRAVPQYLATATMPADWPGGVDVVESIERIGLNGLFAIRTRPRHRGIVPVRTVLFFVTAKDLHVGPTREWVELSRRVAADGAQALRWDPAGLGLSSHIGRDPYRNVFSKADLIEAVAVARHACRDPAELELVGVCSGGWYAARVARITGARSATVVNLLAWNWRVISTVLSQWSIRKRALNFSAGIDAVGGTGASRTSRLKARLNPTREATKSFMHEHFPRWLLRVLSWIGLVWLPEVVLTTLARRGTAVTVIASPEDAREFTAKGGRVALERLRRSPRPPRLITTPTGDHPAHHPAILAAIRHAVLPVTAISASERMRQVASSRTS